MAYVITDSCIKDLLCVDVCPTDCIHPKTDEPQFEAATQLFVDPEGCIDCGACARLHLRFASSHRRPDRRAKALHRQERSLLRSLNTKSKGTGPYGRPYSAVQPRS